MEEILTKEIFDRLFVEASQEMDRELEEKVKTAMKEFIKQREYHERKLDELTAENFREKINKQLNDHISRDQRYG